MIQAYAVQKAKGRLKRIEYDPGALGPDQVEIDITACGLCHSDLSMIDNEWGDSEYPLVPGHEIVGRIGQVGANVTHLRVGDAVGLGWFSGSCQTCHACLRGDHNLCNRVEQTIVGRHGGFADKVRSQAVWATPLPAGLDIMKAGPLLCAGITVFNPLVQFDVRPTQRVGVIGIGGLGHLALKILNKWGCEVTAFTSTDSKREDALQMGAHHVVHSRQTSQLRKIAGTLDFIISTVAVEMDWDAYLGALAPGGRLHIVGAVAEPLSVPAFALIGGQHSLSGTPTGAPATLRSMLEFCARHRIEPMTESFPLSRVNDAMTHLRGGKARYRVVLENDFV
ncbi:MAG: NAD(P)-dependent alcohol dehydrogenase [Gammaproteobacteria bacterium]|nr:NAD(P)-dependent alcohol dehydrogenase [Gammaproteobacteria bacterium]